MGSSRNARSAAGEGMRMKVVKTNKEKYEEDAMK
jgi:hypothetical protein